MSPRILIPRHFDPSIWKNREPGEKAFRAWRKVSTSIVSYESIPVHAPLSLNTHTRTRLKLLRDVVWDLLMINTLQNERTTREATESFSFHSLSKKGKNVNYEGILCTHPAPSLSPNLNTCIAHTAEILMGCHAESSMINTPRGNRKENREATESFKLVEKRKKTHSDIRPPLPPPTPPHTSWTMKAVWCTPACHQHYHTTTTRIEYESGAYGWNFYGISCAIFSVGMINTLQELSFVNDRNCGGTGVF